MLTDPLMRFYLYCLWGLLQHDYFVSRSHSQINRRRAQMLAYFAMSSVIRRRRGIR